jgi:hypothetical protein
MARKGQERPGKARKGQERPGKTRYATKAQKRPGKPWKGQKRSGKVRREGRLVVERMNQKTPTEGSVSMRGVSSGQGKNELFEPKKGQYM